MSQWRVADNRNAEGQGLAQHDGRAALGVTVSGHAAHLQDDRRAGEFVFESLGRQRAAKLHDTFEPEPAVQAQQFFLQWSIAHDDGPERPARQAAYASQDSEAGVDALLFDHPAADEHERPPPPRRLAGR